MKRLTMHLIPAALACLLSTLAWGNPIAPTQGPRDTVTWGDPPYSHNLYKVVLGKGDTFYWTDGDDAPDKDGNFPFHEDTDYGGFTASNGGEFKFKPPKDVNDYHVKNNKGVVVNTGISFVASAGIQHFLPLDALPDGFVYPVFASTSDGPPISEAVDLATYTTTPWIVSGFPS